jgi:tight adherence protein C
MPVYVVLGALALAGSIPVLWVALSSDRAPARQVARNLTAGLASGGDMRGIVLSQSPMERIVHPATKWVGRHARRVSPASMVASLERRIELSGSNWVIEAVLAVKLCLAGGLLLAGGLWAASSPSPSRVLAAVAAGVAGYLVPDSVMARKARERQEAILVDLADTLDQLAVCVGAGLGLDSALARAAASGHGPLAAELARLLQDIRVGLPRADALEGLITRTDVAELRQFVHAVSQAEKYGVPIIGVLRSQASEQREKRRFRAEERAMKLPVKVVFPLVFCILPAMFVVILGPAALRVTNVFG